MITIGIDPGMTGAIAIIEDDILHAVHDMPTVTGTDRKQQVNIPELASILRMYGGEKVILEKVHAMPKQGVTSSFNFGMGYGAIQGIVQTLGNPIDLVTPQAWKKAAGILKTDKDYARTRALQIFPDAELARKKDIGRADAILIAKYG